MERSLPAPAPDVRTLLAAHGLAGVPEEPLVHDGFSGAHISRLVRADGRTFVLKRMSVERDWIMQATNDIHCRESVLARASLALPDGIRTPRTHTASDGAEYALLLDDISAHLLPQGVVEDAIVDRIVERMAELHRTRPPDNVPVPWCDLRLRLTLLTPETAKIPARFGAQIAHDVTHGWALFARHAPPPAAALARSLLADPAPLIDALHAEPPVFVHGDLKFDNIGIDAEGRMWLIDWALTLLAPRAVELGWFLAINSRRMRFSLADVMRRYAGAAGMRAEERRRHDALTVLCGLILRGWRKALDAEAGDPDELNWWCERGVEAARILGLDARVDHELL